MDVDVQGMSPDPDGQADTTAGPSAGQDRDGDSEAIVRQLEKSLPRWEGFGDLGWMSEVAQVCSCRPLHYDARRGEGLLSPLFASFCVFSHSFFESNLCVMMTWVITHTGATIGNRVGDQEPQGQRVRLAADPLFYFVGDQVAK
jgi:hypothetical protein